MTSSTQLNNVGVQLLHAGLLDDAFEAFKASLEIVKQHIAFDWTVEHDLRQTQCALPDLCPSTVYSRLSIKQKKARLRGRGTAVQDVAPESCFVSQEAVTIPIGYVSGYSRAWESSVILFNLGLTVHLVGLKPGMGLSCLDRALQLYQMSKQLITSHIECAGNAFQSNEMFKINEKVIMSLMNNIGHVLHETGDYRASRTYFDCLTDMMHESARASTDPVLPFDLEGFLLNAMILSQPQVAAAA